MIRPQNITAQAKRLGACRLADSPSDWKSLVRLFFAPQGAEFCERYNYPSTAQFRECAAEIAPYGVFVDAGEIVLDNATRVGVIGDTFARLSFAMPYTVHKVILMHGGKAHITATDYAVVRLINMGDPDNVKITTDDTAVILQ